MTINNARHNQLLTIKLRGWSFLPSKLQHKYRPLPLRAHFLFDKSTLFGPLCCSGPLLSCCYPLHCPSSSLLCFLSISFFCFYCLTADSEGLLLRNIPFEVLGYAQYRSYTFLRYVLFLLINRTTFDGAGLRPGTPATQEGALLPFALYLFAVRVAKQP